MDICRQRFISDDKYPHGFRGAVEFTLRYVKCSVPAVCPRGFFKIIEIG